VNNRFLPKKSISQKANAAIAAKIKSLQKSVNHRHKHSVEVVPAKRSRIPSRNVFWKKFWNVSANVKFALPAGTSSLSQTACIPQALCQRTFAPEGEIIPL
jgi:hypothetical protein